MYRNSVFKWLLVAVTAALVLPVTASAADPLGFAPDIVWGSTGVMDGQFQSVRGVAVDKWGNVFVADNDNNRIQKFNRFGDYLQKWGTYGSAPGQFQDVSRVAVDRWGNIYATDEALRTVQRFNPLGQYSETIDAGAQVRGVAVDLDGTLYVGRPWDDIAVYDSAGVLLRTVDPVGPAEGFGLSQDGDLYVSTEQAAMAYQVDLNKILHYSKSGTYLGSWGATGTAAGQFDRPYGVSVDGAGRVFTVEAVGRRVQVFESDGTPISILTSTTPFALSNPWSIAAGFDRTFYVADQGANKILKWTGTPSAVTTGIAGADRVLTAIEASQRAYPDGAATVVVATSQNWPDALGGAALAGVAKAPMLLTPKDALPSAVEDEIARLGATTVYILGGENAVSSDVYDQLDALMILHEPVRLGGADRYATANLIAEEAVSLKSATYDGTAFVVTGQNFADALSVSPVAAANGWPIYLTRPTELPPTVLAAMVGNGVTHGYIVGGSNAVSAGVADGLNADFEVMPGVDMFMRYEGVNRYETSAVFAEAAWDGMGMLFSRPAIATGQNYPDALAGGVLQGSDYCPLLLTPSASLDPDIEALIEKHADEIYELRFLGGTSALSTGVRSAVTGLLP